MTDNDLIPERALFVLSQKEIIHELERDGLLESLISHPLRHGMSISGVGQRENYQKPSGLIGNSLDSLE